MATPVIMPKQGNSVESCIIQKWRKKPGESVASGEVLLDVETDKAVVEVSAPDGGVLLEVFFKAGDDVPVQTVIAAIGRTGEDVSALKPGAAVPKAEAKTEAAAPVATKTAPAATPAVSTSGAGSSPKARALAEAHALDATRLAGSGPGGLVISRDVEAALAQRPRISPAALEALKKGGLVAPERGTGPDGLVLVEDLKPDSQVESVSFAEPAASDSPYEDTPVKGIRKIIADRLKASLANAAQYTLTTCCKASGLKSLRERIKANAEAMRLPQVTLNDLIVLAVSRTLSSFPDLNAHFLGDKVRRFVDVNLGVAVDTPRGLMVPVLKQASRKSLRQISDDLKSLAKSCQSGSIDISKLEGGTFTISNLGALGIEAFTPVLNAPEVAILGVGGMHLRPFEGPEGVEFLPALSLSLTCDHQVVDGAPAARFLQALTRNLEQPDLLIAL